jgi:tRNA-specific 2-thiouridylase
LQGKFLFMKKLMLAMSGGVDSSVALVLLKKQYDIYGATMRLFDGCDINDAVKIAGQFNIPHYIADLSGKFSDIVINNFIASYSGGETPNPCVVCNKHIKFGAFLEFAETINCELMATGHYARVEYDTGSKRYLLKKADSHKDQSYVLYGLTQEQLSRVIFPLGSLDKNQVREIAQEHNLLSSNKPDSQDICFVPDGDYTGFIKKYTGNIPENGDIIDINNNVIGRHSGIINYTIGQRKGLGISAPKPLYITAKNAENNTVTAGENEQLFSNSLTAREINWIAFGGLKNSLKLYARTRYSQPEQPCTVSPIDENSVRVIFDSPQRAITPGQSVVFYDGDIIIGGGIIN